MTNNHPLPQVYLARHGETEWSRTGQHTGRTDIPLTELGERQARALADRLAGLTFAQVRTSPLQRAARTCSLAGFGEVAEPDADLMEWDYGGYEGVRTADIRCESPDWRIFRDGCPGGESLAQIAARADRAIGRIRTVDGDVLLFAHGHILRVFAARWLGLPATAGGNFLLGTAALSILGYEHDRHEPTVRLWNDCRHLEA